MEDGSSKKDFAKLNDYIKEFLDFNGYNSTLDCFEAEEQTKKVTKRQDVPLNKVPSVSHSLNFLDLRHGQISKDLPIL